MRKIKDGDFVLFEELAAHKYLSPIKRLEGRRSQRVYNSDTLLPRIQNWIHWQRRLIR